MAGFANAKTGGLLLIGFSTKKQGDSEILDSVRPVPRDLVDLDRHRKLVRERVMPQPRDVVVEWIECDSDKGILVIDVPAQPPARLPYVVPGPTRSTDISRLAVAVPIREADATVWLTQSEIQRLIAAGWTVTGGPSDDYLSGLIEQAVTAARREVPSPKAEIEIGEGKPGWKGMFQQAWSELMGQNIWIGKPASVVYWDGPGVVQHFESHIALFGWVLCALPYRRPVAVAGEVWQALQAAGARIPGGDALGAVGFPVPDPQATRMIGADATSIDLVGGQWGDGRLLRDAGSKEWRWEPVVRFSMNMTRAAGYWTAQPTPRQLRLRAVATLPWADADNLAVTSQRRNDLVNNLPISKLAGLVTALAQRRGADLRTAQWNRGLNRNALDAFSYSSLISGPEGQAAASAEVMVALPNTMDSSVVTCAELRVQDLNAWSEAMTAATGARVRHDLRLTMGEVIEFFTVVWETVTEVLPAVLAEDTSMMHWADPPTVELQFAAEARVDATPPAQPVLDDFIDMNAFGSSDRGQLQEMAVTIIAPPRLDSSARQGQTRKALAYIAQQFGFLDATEDRL